MWHRGLGALWQVESSQTRDWTRVLTLADGFLTTKLPGKSTQVQAWFCPAQLCSLHLPAASPMPLTPLLLEDLVLLFRLNHPLVTDSGLPWGSASSLGWASPLTRGLLPPSMATLRVFLSSPSKNDLLLICSTNFHQSPSMCQVHRHQAISANTSSSLGDMCPRGRVCLGPTRGVPAGSGPPWVLLLENPVLLLRPSWSGGQRGPILKGGHDLPLLSAYLQDARDWSGENHHLGVLPSGGSSALPLPSSNCSVDTTVFSGALWTRLSAPAFSLPPTTASQHFPFAFTGAKLDHEPEDTSVNSELGEPQVPCYYRTKGKKWES